MLPRAAADGVGWGGQRLYVVPSLGMVVAVTASNDTLGVPQYLAGYTALDLALRAAGGPSHQAKAARP
jgi:hypothetical protein